MSHEAIARTLKVSKGVVVKYLGLAAAAGLDCAAARDLDERELVGRLLARSSPDVAYVVPDWGCVHRELDRKGVTLMLLWQEYVAKPPHGRTWR